MLFELKNNDDKQFIFIHIYICYKTVGPNTETTLKLRQKHLD